MTFEFMILKAKKEHNIIKKKTFFSLSLLIVLNERNGFVEELANDCNLHNHAVA